MKKFISVLIIGLIMLTGCNSSNEIEEEINTENMKELPKVVYEKLEEYVQENDIINEAKNSGNFDITKVDMGNNTYLEDNSYYYVTNGDIYMYVEYIYDSKYLCKMTISTNKETIASFTYDIIDK